MNKKTLGIVLLALGILLLILALGFVNSNYYNGYQLFEGDDSIKTTMLTFLIVILFPVLCVLSIRTGLKLIGKK
mgnify:CR=1 FL=1